MTFMVEEKIKRTNPKEAGEEEEEERKRKENEKKDVMEQNVSSRQMTRTW